MSQSADIQLHSLEAILEILRSQALAMPVSATSSRYLHALNSLSASIVGTHGSCVRELSEECAAGLSQGETAGDTAAEAADTEPLAPILQAALADWLISLRLTATPYATASLYLDIISSLYGSAVKANLLPPTKLFSQLKVSLKALGTNGWKTGINDEIFTRALRLTKNAAHLISDDSIAADLVIWSLTHSLMPLTDIALLKRDEFMGGCHSDRQKDTARSADTQYCGSAADTIIISRHCLNARRKYIFDLRQSERTPKQLEKHIAKIVNALFKRARLPQATDPYQTVEALWAYAALRAGIPASAVVAYLGHAPLGLPVLKLSVVRCPLSESAQAAKDAMVGTHGSCVRVPSDPENEKNTAQSANTEPTAPILRAQRAYTSYCGTAADTFKENFSAVGKIFLENPPRWYAMSLRPGVRFTQVCRRLELLGDRIPQPQLFYPCEEIARAIGKKIVTRQRPFIHSVVFFRAKLTDIGRLFSKLGDLAWCYRQSARPGAPYADISDRQFQLFQQTIASFTPDYEVASTGELELKKNDRVQILGGLFAGHEATMEGVVNVGTHGSCVLEPSEECAAGLSPDVPHAAPTSSNVMHTARSANTAVKAADTARSADTSAKAADTARSADTSATPSVIYRLNIVGDNGIEWRINVDSRLLSPSAKTEE